MGSHKHQTVPFILNNGTVMTNGQSAKLAKGQFGIIQIDRSSATALGQKVSNVIPTTPKEREFQLAIGAPELTPSKQTSNQSWKSRPFKLSEVLDISVSAPKIGITLDKWLFGYNGKAGSEIILKNGDVEVIDITLEGDAIGMLGYEDSQVTVQLILQAPNEGTFTMHEIVEKGVEELKRTTLKGNVPITEYVKITPINNENTATVAGVSYTFFTLTVTDEGRLSDLALVQAQYPAYDVKQTDYKDGKSTYTVIAPAGTSLSNYVQTFVSTADVDCDGIPEITTNTVSTAWVTGNTCKAAYENYTIQLADTKCGDNRLAELQANYPNLSILVNTAQQRQTVTLTGTSGTGNIVINGINYLTTFNTNLTTTASNFASTHALVLLDKGITVTASSGVLTFTANTGVFPLITFSNATLTLGATLGSVTGIGAIDEFLCQTVYRTKVLTNIVCEDCDPMLRDLFVSEQPSSFEFVDWVKDSKIYSESAKMGIMLEGKEFVFSGTEEYREDIPFAYTSTRIYVANQAPGMVNESYNIGTNGRIALKNLSRATDPVGLGKDLWMYEDYAWTYFTGFPKHKGNNYAKWVLGEESLLKPLNYYVMYSVKVRPVNLVQSFSGELVENIDYVIIAEVGKHAAVESYVNALATAAGLPTVSVY